jgi:antirestriction protein ArdC
MIQAIKKLDLIIRRGCACEVCGVTKWRGESIAPCLKMARKDRENMDHTEENCILVCAMCFYMHGYNKRRSLKNRQHATYNQAAASVEQVEAAALLQAAAAAYSEVRDRLRGY